MNEPVNLEIHRGKKKEPCPFCGGEGHAEPFTCPRVSAIEYDHNTGAVYRVEFKDSEAWEPDLAG